MRFFSDGMVHRTAGVGSGGTRPAHPQRWAPCRRPGAATVPGRPDAIFGRPVPPRSRPAGTACRRATRPPVCGFSGTAAQRSEFVNTSSERSHRLVVFRFSDTRPALHSTILGRRAVSAARDRSSLAWKPFCWTLIEL